MIFTLDERRVTFESENYFIAHNATVIGSVLIGDNASIWYNAVLRGDSDVIAIGADTNVQDGSVLHVDAGMPLTLGRGVTVGHKAVVHGCTVGNYSLIGINAVVLNRAQIGNYCIIGANTLIPEDKVIPDGSLVVGTPGRVIRQISEQDRQVLETMAAHYVENGRRFRAQLKPDPRG
ncbi:MAG TPA: gamma carbonic anhydrase family protein [Spongiibacteraceae bacterium]|jgi:carbonic anhydrase/acetyltransferase-like protein (isoleucine patch superfamily)